MVLIAPKARPLYPEKVRHEALQIVSRWAQPREFAEALGVSEQTLRNWHHQDERDRGERDDGLTTDEREELRRLWRENARRTDQALVTFLTRNPNCRRCLMPLPGHLDRPPRPRNDSAGRPDRAPR